MQKIIINGHIICYEEFKYLENKNLKNFIDEKKYLDILKILDEETIIVLGGDGSFLTAIKNFLMLEKPFLGINFGNKGFLLNDFKFINSKKIIKKNYPLVENTLKTKTNSKTFYSFNEIDLRAGNGRIITLEISLNKKNLLYISGDGIIISTPAGSTGYNNSLSGPIIPHGIETFVLTPKAPFSPKGQNPILISFKNIIKLRNIGRKNTLQIYSDSHLIFEGTGESVSLETKLSIKKIELLIFKDYLKTWEEKILFEQGFSSIK